MYMYLRFLGLWSADGRSTLRQSEEYIELTHLHGRSATMTEITFKGSEFASLKDKVIIVTGK